VSGTVRSAGTDPGAWLLRTPEGATYRLQVDPRQMPLAEQSAVEVSGAIAPPGPRDLFPSIAAQRIAIAVR
jgi:hypothetical protein